MIGGRCNHYTRFYEKEKPRFYSRLNKDGGPSWNRTSDFKGDTYNVSIHEQIE